MWVASLVMVLVMALGSVFPGVMAWQIADRLHREAGLPPVSAAQLEADPFLELPFGTIPHSSYRWENVPGPAFDLPSVTVSLDNMRVQPQAIWQGAPPRLLQPMTASLAVRADKAQFQRSLDRVLSPERLGRLIKPGTPLGAIITRAIGESIRAEAILEAGAIGVRLVPADTPPNGVNPGVAVTGTLSIRDEGRKLVWDNLSASLMGFPVPPVLLKAAAANLPPLLDPVAAGWPGENWRIVTASVQPDAVWVVVQGLITALPEPGDAKR